MNQCDGCNSNMPIVNGIHRNENGRAHMACTAEGYKSTETHNFCPRALPPITFDGKVDVTECNWPSAEEVAAARRAVDMTSAGRSNLG